MDSSSLAGNKNDGKIVIRFSRDDIEAWADFTPPQGGGLPITNDYLLKMLERVNITYGIHWDTLRDTALKCNLDRVPIPDVLIALGRPPVKEIIEYFELNPHLAGEKKPLADKKRNDQIDYRSFSPFTIVHKDQVLAVKHPHVLGQEGKNVHNAAIPFGVKQT
jgi:uncharacterized protein (DUF342 family)